MLIFSGARKSVLHKVLIVDFILFLFAKSSIIE